jgi:hypothetical protein
MIVPLEQPAQQVGGDAHKGDGLCSLLRRQPGRGKAKDDGIVSSQHQVDHHDLQQCDESFAVHDIGHETSLRARSIA